MSIGEQAIETVGAVSQLSDRVDLETIRISDGILNGPNGWKYENRHNRSYSAAMKIVAKRENLTRKDVASWYTCLRDEFVSQPNLEPMEKVNIMTDMVFLLRIGKVISGTFHGINDAEQFNAVKDDIIAHGGVLRSPKITP